MKITGKTIALRTAEITDAEFILELRTQSDKTQFLSQVENDLAKQQAWLKAYKHKELNGEEYYFVIETHAGQKLGLVRVYDLQLDSFCWGSWLIKDGAPFMASLESMVMVYEFGFGYLNKAVARIDVRAENKKVISTHKNFGAKILSITALDYFFEMERSKFHQSKAQFDKYLK